jgi:S1-C subfamily serine protease
MLTRDAGDGEVAAAVADGVAPGRQSLEVFAAAHDGRIVSGIAVPADGDVGPLDIDLRPLDPGDEPKLELQGIGAVLAADENGIVVKAVLPTGGAAAAGMVAGDVIVAVDDTPVEQLGFPGAIQMLRGPEGSTVNVTVRHVDGSTTVIAVTRRRLQS